MKKIHFVVIMINLGLIGTANTEMRTWLHSSGKTIDAELVAASNLDVTLRSKDGREGTIHRGDLSIQDQQYITDWLKVQSEPIKWCKLGASRSSGNSLELKLYDLKFTHDGEVSDIGEDWFDENGKYRNRDQQLIDYFLI